MSVVIALKFKNGVILGSDRQVTMGWNKQENTVTKVRKFEEKNMAIGGVGSIRELQKMFTIERSLLENVSKLTEANCVGVVNNITNEYRKFSYIGREEVITYLDGSFIFADAYNINYVAHDLGIVPNLDYFAIGCGDDLATGYLNVQLKDRDVTQLSKSTAEMLLINAIRTACKNSIGIDNNVNITPLYKEPQDLVPDVNLKITYKCLNDLMDIPNKKSICGKKKCTNCKKYLKFIYDEFEDELNCIPYIN